MQNILPRPRRVAFLLALTVLVTCKASGVKSNKNVVPVEGTIVAELQKEWELESNKAEGAALSAQLEPGESLELKPVGPFERALSSSDSYSDDYIRRRRRRRRKRRRRQRMRMRRRRMRSRRGIRNTAVQSFSSLSFSAPERWTGTSSWSQHPAEDGSNGRRKRMMMWNGMKMMRKGMWRQNNNMMRMTGKKMMRPCKMRMTYGMNNMMMKGGANRLRMIMRMGGMNAMRRKKKVVRLTWNELRRRRRKMEKRARGKWIRRQRRMEQRRKWKDQLSGPEAYVYHLYYDSEDVDLNYGFEGDSTDNIDEAFTPTENGVLASGGVASVEVRDAFLANKGGDNSEKANSEVYEDGYDFYFDDIWGDDDGFSSDSSSSPDS